MAERITHEYIEVVVGSRSPKAMISQEYIEAVVGSRSPHAMISQQYIEVLVLNFVASPTGRVQGPPIQMM